MSGNCCPACCLEASPAIASWQEQNSIVIKWQIAALLANYAFEITKSRSGKVMCFWNPSSFSVFTMCASFVASYVTFLWCNTILCVSAGLLHQGLCPCMFHFTHISGCLGKEGTTKTFLCGNPWGVWCCQLWLNTNLLCGLFSQAPIVCWPNGLITRTKNEHKQWWG